MIDITEASHHHQLELPTAGTPEQETTEPTTPITVATETTVEAPAIAVPSPLKVRGVAPSPTDLIPFNKDCFSFSKKDGPRSKEAAKKAKTRAVRDLVIAMCDESLTLEQQVYDLPAAIKHHVMKVRSASAGILLSSTNKSIDEQIVTNVHDTIQLARTTDSSMYGRTCDDKRSLVHSILCSCLPSPRATKGMSLRKLSRRLGIPWVSFYNAVKQLKTKKAALAGIHSPNDSVVFSCVVKRKGWAKRDEFLKKIVVQYIINHPNVIQSPIMNGTILVKDPTDSSKKIKKNKLLLQTSVRKLHSDSLIADVPECTSSDGKVIVSDTKLRA